MIEFKNHTMANLFNQLSKQNQSVVLKSTSPSLSVSLQREEFMTNLTVFEATEIFWFFYPNVSFDLTLYYPCSQLGNENIDFERFERF